MKPVDARGFSLIELAIVVLVMGMVLAMAVPAMTGFRSSHAVRTAAENIAGQLRLARERAISTGVTQTVRFRANTYGGDYHVLNGTTIGTASKLPRGVQYLWSVGTQDTFRLTKDGRSQESGTVIVQDGRGVRDSVSVQQSGMVLIR